MCGTGEEHRDHPGADSHRPATSLRERGGRPHQQQGNDVEEVPVTNDIRPAEAEVERGGLDGQCAEREDRQGGEGAAPAARRADERSEHPAASEHEGHEAAP